MFRFVPNGASSYWVTTQMKQNGTANKYDLYPGFAYHKFDDVCFPCIGFKPYRPIRYGDSVLYGAAVRHNDHQHLPVNTSLFMASENTQAASSSDPELVVRTVQIGALTNMVSYTNTMAVGTTRTRTWDFLVKEQGGRKIVVALIEQQTDRGCTTPTLMFVYASEGDLSEWREIFRFRTPEGTFARSFEYANGKFYFGLGSEADVGKGNQPNWMPLCSLNEKGASIYTGEIYSYAYDLFDEGNNPPALPTAAFASAAQTVQENAGTVSISVVLSQASSSAVSIPFTLGGTALAVADYQIPAPPLTIPAGQTSGTIDIVLAADGLAEPAETIIVELGTPTGATLGATTTHTLTVAASEAPPPALPTAAFASAAQTVQENAGTVSISVVLSQASSSAVLIPFTLGGTALAGTDYQIPASPLTIPAGQTSGTIDIVLAADGLAEPAETIIVELGTPTGATLGATTTHTLTVAASEAPPPALPTAAFASAAQTVQENAGTVSISVVLSQASSSAVSIPFTLGGTAQAGADYQSPASPLTIPAGQTSGSIAIALTDDGLAEPAETIIVTLGTPTGATLGATTTHTLTVAASEAPPPALPAAVFLKALGEGEVERATQNGTSWATAYTNAQDALTAALASADRTLYVAAGVYPLSNTTAVGDGTLKIYGGFAGVDGETLEDRDTQAHQSIFTGDINGNDCYVHYELSTNGTPSVTKTVLENCPMVSNGRFNRPPAYAGEYDIYATAINGGTGSNLTGDNH